MAATLTVDKDQNEIRATYVDTAGGGTALVAQFEGAVALSVQRVSGSGTYSVTGSLDGSKFGVLPTDIAAINDDLIKVITGSPRYVKVAIASAAATVVVRGVR